MKLFSAVDLSAWLDTLATDDATLLVLRQSGYTLTEIAEAGACAAQRYRTAIVR